jgi:apolipoprotein N-acyltransferase
MLMNRFAGWVRTRTGWRRALVAFAAGAASNAAMAPFHVWPVFIVTLSMLVWMIDGAVTPLAPASDLTTTSPKRWWQLTRTRLWRHTARLWHASPTLRVATIGWCFGFGYFFFGLLWIGEAFLVNPGKIVILLPFAVTGLPTGLALFWAGAAAAATLAWRPGLLRVLVLALALAVAEWLRGHLLTGFPWNVIGYALTYPLSLMQTASVIGIYGLTVIAVFVLAAPLVAWVDGGRARSSGGITLVATVAILMTYGHWYLAQPAPVAADAPRVRLVQPSVLQREKWMPVHQRRIFNLHLDLTKRNASGVEDGAAGVDLVLWPEAAMPFLPLETPEAIELIGKALPQGTYLVSGALRADPPTKPDDDRHLYNSLLAFGAGGKLVATYDKIHLVPFGEFLPFFPLLNAIGLEPLTRRGPGFVIGTTPRPLISLPGLPTFAPLICYEAIFPREAIQGAERPAFLANVTNDGWFGNTTGPRQHLHQASVRAVEEGLPLLRAANNGITAVIDAHGRVLARLDLDVVGVIDARLPGALPPTIYGRFGDLGFLLMLMAGFAVILAGTIRQGRASAIPRGSEHG